ncbi:MAG: CARDB domain-containing protein [Myxococcota bacterium]|jgi:hypothetical protein|nr:CARDB domain-containing protein [Myxococcota bacterium]
MLTRSLSFSPLVWIAALFLLTLTACGGCGENNNPADNASATVSIEAIDPALPYQGTEVSVSFEITPGAETSAEALTYRVDFGDGERDEGEDIAIGVATHTYEISGEFTVVVSALAGGEVIASAERDLTVSSPIELSIEAVRGQPANIDAGDDLTISATLSNNLAQDLTAPIEVGAYLSKERVVTLEDLDSLISLGTELVRSPGGDQPVIGAGADRAFSFTKSIPPELDGGDYTLVVVIDPAEQTLDEDRSNNLGASMNVIRVTNPNQIEPDLVVLDVVAAPDRAFPELSSVTRGFRIVNNGGLDLFDIVAETYLSVGDAILDDSDTLIHTTQPVQQLTSRGGSQEFIPTSFVLDQAILPPPNMELEVYVIVKAYSRDDVTESDEANNIAASPAPILVTDQLVDGPDIVVRDFIVTPERTFLDGALEYELVIANEGTVDVSSFLCRVYLGDQPRVNTLMDQPVDSINITNLASDSERTINDTITISALFDPGTYYMYVICDPNDLLGEPFRSNNQKLHPNPITITDQADVDISISSVTVPQMVNEGDSITIEAEVCATGTNATGNTRVELYQTPGSRVDFNVEPVASSELENINPGECTTATFSIPATCAQFQEKYAIGVIVDANDTLPETNEQNNARSGDNLMTIAGTFCICTEDSFEPNNRPADAQSVPRGASELALCVAGTCDFFKTPPLVQGESVIITNTHAADKGVLSTKLFDPSGLQGIDIDRNASGVQEVAAFLTGGGEYIVEVCGTDTSTRNLYELDIQILERSTGIDITPRNLTLPVRDTFSIGARVNVDLTLYNIGQIDAVDVPVELRISADQTIDANDPLLESLTIPTVANSASININEEVVIPVALADGEYYIGAIVDPNATLTETDVTNNTTISRKIVVATECYDPLEPNDSFADAYPITGSGSFSNLISCNSADDYYEICVPDGKKLTVTINFAHAMGDLDLYLYDSQQQAIDSSATKTDTEQVAIPYVNGNRCYTAYVQKVPVPNQPVENLYSLQVDIQDVNPALLCSSYAEPNDSFGTATSLLAASEQPQSLDRCPVADTDFYFFDISFPGQSITIRGTKDPGAQQGTLRLQLYNPNQTPGINEETAPDQPTASIENFIAPQAGRYWVQVTVSGNARNVTYDLEVEGLSGVDLTAKNLSIGPGTYKVGDQLRIGFDLSNIGTDTTQMAPTYQLYFGTGTSPDPANDIALSAAGYIAPSQLMGNSSVYIFEQENVPAGLAPGTYYLHVVVEDPDDINLNNNTASIPVQVVP